MEDVDDDDDDNMDVDNDDWISDWNQLNELSDHEEVDNLVNFTELRGCPDWPFTKKWASNNHHSKTSNFDEQHSKSYKLQIRSRVHMHHVRSLPTVGHRD